MRMTYDEGKRAIKRAIAQFPATFGLYAYPGRTFRLSESSSYINDADEVTLYTQVLRDDGTWGDFAKGSIRELKNNFHKL